MRTFAIVASFVTALVLRQASPAAPEQKDASLMRFEFTEPQMGVPFRIVLYAPDLATAQSAAQAAFARVAQLNEIMSDYETDSELNELSRTSGQNRQVRVSEDLWAVLMRAQELAEKTEGAFDVTVGPAVSLWRKARRVQQEPDSERLAESRKAIGYKFMRLNPGAQTVELTQPHMKLDLGGIAKGYALDEALKVLRSRGLRRALVTGGGDMALGDAPPNETGWRIEIAPLDVPNAPPKRYVRLSHAALATSGDVFQRLEIGGRRYSHIIDPRTGVGLTDHSLVTVIAKDCTTADSLATAASVLGPEKGLRYVESVPEAEGYLVRKPGEQLQILETSGFKRHLEASPIPVE